MSDLVKGIIKQFQYYKQLGEQTFEQLTEEDLFWQYNENSNSIAIIVNHLSGNMLSRWTDFLTTDGEKEWRNRDEEFEDTIKTKEQLLDKWEKDNEGSIAIYNESRSEAVMIDKLVDTIREEVGRSESEN